jgi:hypothetical protein
MDRNLVDFNTLLKAMNLVIMGLIAISAFAKQNGDYLNQESCLLGLLLCIQTHVALMVEFRRRDPFVIFLAFITIIYFELRIYTLGVFSFSTVFTRYPFGPHDTNFALVFIILANLFMYAGFYVVRFRGNLSVNAADWKARRPASILPLILVSMIYVYSDAAGGVSGLAGRALGIVSLFFNPGLIILMGLTYYWLFRDSLSRNFAIALLGIIILDIAVHSILSSRGALVTFVQNCMLIVLAISGSIKTTRKRFSIGVALIPVFVVLLLTLFAVATLNRINRATEGSLDLAQAATLAVESSARLTQNIDVEATGASAIFDRVGFFDFSAEIIAHADRYASVLSVESYGRSIIDNVLSPGFDLFDQPKISNALQFAYNDIGRPMKTVSIANYQSDQIGIYGEYYVLFGYGAFPLFFLTALLFKKVYVNLNDGVPFRLTIKRIAVLIIFGTVINSYGLDWLCLDIVSISASIYLFASRFKSAKKLARVT